MTTVADPVTGWREADLAVEGMTCASCAARIERRLNRLEGVAASVNFATEAAHVRYPAALEVGDLVAQVRAAGYGATPLADPLAGDLVASPIGAEAAGEGARRVGALGRRLVVSAVLAVPVVVLSMVPSWQFDGWQWWALGLATPVVTWGAWPFYRAALLRARHGGASMDTLVSVGVLAAFCWSLVALIWGSAGDPGMHMAGMSLSGAGTDQLYLDVAAGVPVFVLAGRYLEARAKRRSGTALRALLALGARDASVLHGGIEEQVPVTAVVVGDRLVVRPGERFPTDGVVVEGRAAVDRSVLTGESLPVDVGPGDPVTGATVDLSGRLVVEATRVGADTELARIARLVVEAQTGKAAVQRLADRVSAVFVPGVLAVSLVTLAVWLGTGHPAAAAFGAAVAVLVVACPCALGLATPMALLAGTGRGAQRGIVVRGLEVLETTRRLDTVLLDKTGTLTTGHMTLVEVVPAPGEDRLRLLALAAAVEAGSAHPIARAVVAGAVVAGAAGAPLTVEEFTSRDGLGVTGTVAGRAVTVGRPGEVLSAPLSATQAAAEAQGRTVVAVAWDGAVRGLLVVADTPKPSSAAAVAELRALGLDPVLVTGDNPRAARAVASAVGIATDDQHVVAGVLPAGKVEVVRRLQAEGRAVAMVGDGVNDAAALAQADLGMAMGTGTDAAIEAADVTLVDGDLGRAADAIRLARRTLGTIRANLAWAFVYNVAALPLAATGHVDPVLAGAAMAGSSLLVVGNSLRLLRFRFR